jgi:D-glucosaminate-6-phosphate ammonia-lyase
MPNRRKFLQAAGAAPLAGAFAAAGATGSSKGRDYFKELGVRTMINAAGTYTALTASLMRPEVMDAINYASNKFVRLNELHDAVGRRIAELLQCEAAMVPSGAAAALTAGTAACVAGSDSDAIRRIPTDMTGLKTEVIIQKSHRYGYDHAVRNCGVNMVEIETAEELERAVSKRTAMMLFFNANNNEGKIKDEEFVSLGKKHGIPTFNDAAADSLPMENLFKWTKMGFDLVTFSGGKGIRGPQSAGLLLGRRDLINAARMNTSPNGDTVGRGNKVNKEELVGMLAAVESYLKRDHAAEWKEWEKRMNIVATAAKTFPSVTTEVFVPEIANHVPHLHIRWDQAKIKASYADVVKKLRDGEPSIETTPGSNDSLYMNFWMLQPGEAEIVAKRLKEVLKSAV